MGDTFVIDDPADSTRAAQAFMRDDDSGDARLFYTPLEGEIVFVSAGNYIGYDGDFGDGDYSLQVATQDDQGLVLLSGAPACDWYHGCSPTAAATLVGYWDLCGQGDLFDEGSDDDAIYLTANVRERISSAAHNTKYHPTPDDPSVPTPPATSLAGLMGTSVDPLSYGATSVSNIGPGLSSYAAYRGHDFANGCPAAPRDPPSLAPRPGQS